MSCWDLPIPIPQCHADDDGHNDDGHNDDGHIDDGHNYDGHNDDGHDTDFLVVWIIMMMVVVFST